MRRRGRGTDSDTRLAAGRRPAWAPLHVGIRAGYECGCTRDDEHLHGWRRLPLAGGGWRWVARRANAPAALPSSSARATKVSAGAPMALGRASREGAGRARGQERGTKQARSEFAKWWLRQLLAAAGRATAAVVNIGRQLTLRHGRPFRALQGLALARIACTYDFEHSCSAVAALSHPARAAILPLLTRASAADLRPSSIYQRNYKLPMPLACPVRAAARPGPAAGRRQRCRRPVRCHSMRAVDCSAGCSRLLKWSR